ncbi:MAG: NAD(P)-binding domain-containing protein, partial [Actinomycetota bacterium]
MRIAYIGLGALGAPIAMNLLRDGHELAVTDLDRSAGDELVAAGARWADDPADAAAGADVAFTCLPSTR